MRDARPRTAREQQTRYVTEHTQGNMLNEFENADNMRLGLVDNAHQLTPMFDGTQHVVANTSFYYQEWGKRRIIRVDTRHNSVLAQLNLGTDRHGRTQVCHPPPPGDGVFSVICTRIRA